MSETKFRVGDICEAHGNKGKVIEIELFSPHVAVVLFNDGSIERYLPCGRLAKYHKEPSLRLIERPKKKVTKTMYQVIWTNEVSEERHISTALYKNEFDAKDHYGRRFIALGPAITFEVEE